MIHVVFVLPKDMDHSVVKCYHSMSKDIGAAILYEERRIAYLEHEAKLILETQEEFLDDHSSAFQHCLDRSSLCQSLRKIFDQIIHTGKT